jgi:hypothetical protein
MNKILLTIVASAVVAIFASNAVATYSGPSDSEGDFNGTVFMNGHDSDGDGLNGRSGLLRVRHSKWRFMEINIDVTINFANPQGECPAGQTQLFPSGEIVLSDYSGDDALFLKIDEDTVACDGDSPEVITATIGVYDAISGNVLSGRGDYDNVSGDMVLTLPSDAVLRSGPAFGEPVMVHVYDASFVIDYD